MSKTIVILEDEATAALLDTGTVTKTTVIKTRTAAQEAIAMSILAGISNKKWIASDSVEGVKGSITDTILLPEKITENG